MMRKMGYDVADCRTYDQLTEEEKLERKQNPVKHGIDAVEYKKAHINELADEYKQLITENKELKVELTKKETLIKKLKDEVQKYKDMAFDIKEKFAMITNKIGSRIMKVLGIDPPAGIPEMPAHEVNMEIKNMIGGLKQIEPNMCRVVPDSKPGTFKVVYKTVSGAYETLRGGFVTRTLADQFRRSIKDASKDYGESEDDSMKMKY